MRSLVYYYTHLPQAFEVAGVRLSGDPGAWLPHPAAVTVADAGWTVLLHADGADPGSDAGRLAIVTVGPATSAGGALRRAMTWRARSPDAPIPLLEADLELAPLPGHGCQLSIIGSYRPPLPVHGEGGDRLAEHRVVEACVRRFVLDLANRLEASTLPA